MKSLVTCNAYEYKFSLVGLKVTILRYGLVQKCTAKKGNQKES